MFDIYAIIAFLLHWWAVRHKIRPAHLLNRSNDMITALILAGALAVQGASQKPMNQEDAAYVDVAYAAMSSGRTEAAIAQLQRALATDPSDPAALINLGTAYARLGRNQEAAKLFRAAIVSSNQYDLQLADGRWVDSRRAARMAAAMLERRRALAVK